MSQLKVNSVVDASGGNTATINTYTPTESNMGGKNRIINGDMRIAQRGTAAVTTSDSYPVDRFVVSFVTDGAFSAQQDSSAPTGFVNSLKYTTTTADASLSATQYTTIQQRIEGTNVSDLAWGTASAKTVTLSFWVRSSLTGTFGGSLLNSAVDRSYPFTYSISAANTWEQKSVTIAGDTSGSWLTTTGLGVRVVFGLGVGSTYSGTAGSWASSLYLSATGATSVIGTLNATWYVTGVQFEVGSVATPFERRDYGTELAMCYRYYYKTSSTGTPLGTGYNNTTTTATAMTTFPVTMRTAPTALEQSGTATNYRVYHANTATTCSSVPTFSYGAVNLAVSVFTVSSGLTAGQGSASGVAGGGVTSYLAWSAEL